MRLTLLPALALLPFAFGQLNKLTKAKGKTYFGSATDNGELSDTQYVAILDDINEFGQITPGNTMKWQYTEPTQNTFDFSGGDVIANLAKTKGQLLRCHTLVWHSQLPSWVTSGTWTNATLIAAMRNHIANEVTHYKGQCYAWDVVNEALNDDGTYRSSPFYDTIGPEFIPIAFMTAAQYDPTVKLYYNDYNLEYGSAKATAAQNIVKGLKARGIKIDGVGLQAHMIVGSTPSLSSMTTVLNSFTTLGVEVAYTELDIRHSTLPPTDAALAQQSTDYVSMVGSCIQTTGCVGVTIWDFTDRYSWIPSVFSGQGEACLWNADFTKKPAYTAVVSLLGGSATTSSSSSKPSSTSSTKTTLTTSTIKTTSTTKTTSTSKTTTTSAAPTGGTIAKWGQCAGQTWTGSGTCVAGTTCTYSNPWYSQCL